MNLPRIDYRYNWNNKLNCIAFTTIRLRNDDKYRIGQAYEQWHDDTLIGVGCIRAITHFKLHQLSDFMAFVDTGYDRATTIQLFKSIYQDHTRLGKQVDLDTADFSILLIVMPAMQTCYITPTPAALRHQAGTEILTEITNPLTPQL